MKRAEKIALLTQMLNGQASPQAVQRLKDEQVPWFMVVTDNGSPELTDLVNTRLPDEQGRTCVPYADFLKDPISYGQRCITVDQQP